MRIEHTKNSNDRHHNRYICITDDRLPKDVICFLNCFCGKRKKYPRLVNQTNDTLVPFYKHVLIQLQSNSITENSNITKFLHNTQVLLATSKTRESKNDNATPSVKVLFIYTVCKSLWLTLHLHLLCALFYE